MRIQQHQFLKSDFMEKRNIVVVYILFDIYVIKYIIVHTNLDLKQKCPLTWKLFLKILEPSANIQTRNLF